MNRPCRSARDAWRRCRWHRPKRDRPEVRPPRRDGRRDSRRNEAETDARSARKGGRRGEVLVEGSAGEATAGHSEVKRPDCVAFPGEAGESAWAGEEEATAPVDSLARVEDSQVAGRYSLVRRGPGAVPATVAVRAWAAAAENIPMRGGRSPTTEVRKKMAHRSRMRADDTHRTV